MHHYKALFLNIFIVILFLFLVVYGTVKHNKKAQYFINTSNFIEQQLDFNTEKDATIRKSWLAEKAVITQEKSVHASALVEIDNGLMLLFFGGSGEGKKDVKIYQSFLDTSAFSKGNLNATWSEPNAILTAPSLAKMTGKFIKTLGNPIVFKDKNNKLHVFVVATSLGGWATSRIYQFHFSKDLKQLIFEQELKLNPFMNYSNLIRSPGVALQNGGVMLPLYHEMAKKFPLVAFFDSNAKLIFTKPMTNTDLLIQPSIAVINATSCLASYRAHKSGHDNIQLLQKCDQSGNEWQFELIKSNLENYGTSSIMLRFNKGFLLIHNDPDQNPILNTLSYCREDLQTNIQPDDLNAIDIKKINQVNCLVKNKQEVTSKHANNQYNARQSLSLFYLKDAELEKDNVTFKRLATIDVIIPSGEVSYPAAFLDTNFLHISYTYGRRSIKYIALSTEKINELIENKHNENILLSEGIN